MKATFRSSILLWMVPFVLWSCKKDETRAVVQTGTAPVLSVSANSVTLTKATENNTGLTFTFIPAEFGYKAAVTYTLQFCKPGNNFVTIGQVAFPDNKTSQAVLVKT